MSDQSSLADDNDRTIAIDQQIWEVEKDGKLLTITIIDFGGNDLYKIVHHLFMDSSALFLLVLNLAEYSQQIFHRHIGSWLSVLDARVPTASVRLLASHADECDPQEIPAKLQSIQTDLSTLYGVSGNASGVCIDGITVVSSKDVRIGISDVRDYVTVTALQKGIVLPKKWLGLYKVLCNSPLPFLRFEDAYKMHRSLATNFQLVLNLFRDEKEHLRTILTFYHEIGAVLWYHHHPELAQFVFHRPRYLTDLTKAVFSERLETELLDYSHPAFKTKLSQDAFKLAKQDLLQRGVMSRELLQGLWELKGLANEVFSAMIQLFIHLGWCYKMAEDEQGNVTSLRFPWFLEDTVPPQDATLQQLLFSPPCRHSHRLTLEYEFMRLCPPTLYEKFAVFMHRHIHDWNSRRDWKDGAFARIRESRVLVQRLTRGTQTVIRIAVEGQDVVEVWTVLQELKHEMEEVMSEWPGIKCPSHYRTWLVCPHCVHYSHEEPCRFPGEYADKLCPKGQLQMRCQRGDVSEDVPACLVYHVKGRWLFKCLI